MIMIIFGLGLGFTLGVLNVFFRDVGQFFGIVLQFWFWLTPIIYPADVLPERVREYMRFNPMSSVMSACQNIIVKGELPNWFSIMPTVLAGILLCLIGFRLFRKHSGEMVDEL